MSPPALCADGIEDEASSSIAFPLEVQRVLTTEPQCPEFLTSSFESMGCQSGNRNRVPLRFRFVYKETTAMRKHFRRLNDLQACRILRGRPVDNTRCRSATWLRRADSNEMSGVRPTVTVFPDGLGVKARGGQMKPRRGRVRARLGSCPITRKVRFRDHAEAVAALHAAEVARVFSAGQTNRQECRSYACNACHGWHLTSTAALSA